VNRVDRKTIEEVPLNWNKWVRQTLRWLSIAFTLAVIVNIVAVVQGKYTSWVGLSAPLPLVLLLFTGLYLFVAAVCHQVGQRATHRLNPDPEAGGGALH